MKYEVNHNAFDSNSIINIITSETTMVKGLDKAMSMLPLLSVNCRSEMIDAYRFCEDYALQNDDNEVFNHAFVNAAEKEYIKEITDAFNVSPLHDEISEVLHDVLTALGNIGRGTHLVGQIDFEDWSSFIQFNDACFEINRALILDALLQEESMVPLNVYNQENNTGTCVFFGDHTLFVPMDTPQTSQPVYC